jgi:hypothetical protein
MDVGPLYETLNNTMEDESFDDLRQKQSIPPSPHLQVPFT